MMTQHEFVSSEIDKWGFEEVETLLDKGFEPVLTTKGWRWLHVLTQAPTRARIAGPGTVVLPVSTGSR